MTISPGGGLIGSQRPRVCNYPSYATTAGPDAVELAASVGLMALPWQANILEPALGERADGRWSAPEVGLIVGRQNGKNVVVEMIELAGLVLFGEELILHSAHEFKTAMEAFRRIVARFENYDDLRRRVKKVINANGDEGIELLSGQRLRFVARSKGSGRGFSADRIILDEAYELTAAQVEALIPTMNARPNPQLMYTSSPPLDAISGEQLMAVRERGEAGDDPELAWFDFGAAGELEDLSGIDLDDRALWAATNPSYGMLLPEQAIARNRRIMSPVGFAREQIGIWPRRITGSGVIDPKMWAALADERSQAGPDVAIAIDTTPDRRWTSIGLYALRADGLGHLEVIDRRPGTAWVVERIAQLKDRHDPIAIGLDLAGPAGSLLTDFQKAGVGQPEDPEQPRRGDLAVPGAREWAAACGQLLDAVTQATDRHIDQVDLNVAIAGAKTRPLGDATAWARRTAECDISPLCVVTLARWAFLQRAHLIKEEQPMVPLVSWR